MASSRPIAAGETYTPNDINNLRADVLDPVGGHKHDGADGARVPFSNLDVVSAAGSTAPSGGSKSYNDIANHVSSNSNIHGLFTGISPAGAVAAGVLIQHRSNDSTNPVTFPIAFSGNPTVVVTGSGIGLGTPDNSFWGYHVYNVSTTGFTWQAGAGSPHVINWIAIGLKTS